MRRLQYVENIENLVDLGFKNIIPILDNKFELDLFNITLKRKFNIGIRIAAEEEPKFDFYTSRLGIRYNDKWFSVTLPRSGIWFQVLAGP